jgi:hypothetical protein
LTQQKIDMISTKYIIIDTIELDGVDFEIINETSVDTLRYSIDSNKTFVSWDGESPAFIDSLLTKSEIYSEDDILEIMEQPEWKKIL